MSQTKKTEPKTPNPFAPGLPLLCKLGSALVHAEEFLSPTGHHLDIGTFQFLMTDPEVQQWLKSMKVYLPVKR